MKRRIEITRERWTRLSLRQANTPVCPKCQSAPELRTVPEAAHILAISVDSLDLAIRTGLLPVWDASPEGMRICVGCLRNLLANKKEIK